MRIRQCIIIEDSAASALILTNYLANLPFIHVVGVFESYAESVSFLYSNAHELDLIFLDVELSNSNNSGLNGLDILKTFTSLPPVIIISNFADYAIQSYELGKTIDYLQKPYSFDRLMIAINRVLNETYEHPAKAMPSEFIFIKMGRRLQKFELAQIDYVEAYGIYTKVFVKGEPYVVNENISTLEKRLDEVSFARVHKSYIVNIKHINSIENQQLVIGPKKVPIGGTFKEKLSSLLRLFDVLD
jgi:two-component system, LytTR family, response regulator LytT